MELVHYFGGWIEGQSKQTDRTDGGWVQTTFGAKAEQLRGGQGGGYPPLLQDMYSTGNNVMFLIFTLYN